MKFTTQVFGKWILAGEHAVLRGCPALVFPLFGRSLRLTYVQDEQPLRAEFLGEHSSEMQLLFWGVIERAFNLIGVSRADFRGRFELANSMPIGAGLGASATLCVALGRWLVWRGLVTEAQLYEFSRTLENLFHGESSGVDIAVAISGCGLNFERGGRQDPLHPRWQPMWYLSYSGKRGVTSECVARVKALWQSNPTLAAMVDADMREAVEEARLALAGAGDERSFHALADALRKARSCFDRWGLASGEMGVHLGDLMRQGAVAAKPTGSGDGGYVLSLWKTPPPETLRSQLIFLPIETP